MAIVISFPYVADPLSARIEPSATQPREEYVEPVAAVVAVGIIEVVDVEETRVEETERRLVTAAEAVLPTDVALEVTVTLAKEDDANIGAEFNARVVELALVAMDVVLALVVELIVLVDVEFEALV